jgi:lipopolysaccharide/colanic/teichoic acid biosynthesis glycosyltransferase
MRKTYRDSRLFHHSVRVGKKRKAVVITKFRTMRRHAQRLHSAVFQGSLPVSAKLRDADPRVTPWGKLLRKTHVDELPQLISFFRGDLNLMGIRPLLRREFQQLPGDIKGIYAEVGPGLVGVAYACRPFPPTRDQLCEEYRRFFSLWRKSRARAYAVYIPRILFNRLSGHSWSG